MTERSVRNATDRAAMLGLSSRRIADSEVFTRWIDSLFAFSHASHCGAGSVPAPPPSQLSRPIPGASPQHHVRSGAMVTVPVSGRRGR